MSGVKRDRNEQNRSPPSAALQTPATPNPRPSLKLPNSYLLPPLAPPRDEPPSLENCAYNIDRNKFRCVTHIRVLRLDVHDLGLEQLPQLDVVALLGVAAERILELGGGRDFALWTAAGGGWWRASGEEGARGEVGGRGRGRGGSGGWRVWARAMAWSEGVVTVAPLSLRSPTMFMCAPALAMYREVKPN